MNFHTKICKSNHDRNSPSWLDFAPWLALWDQSLSFQWSTLVKQLQNCIYQTLESVDLFVDILGHNNHMFPLPLKIHGSCHHQFRALLARNQRVLHWNLCPARCWRTSNRDKWQGGWPCHEDIPNLWQHLVLPSFWWTNLMAFDLVEHLRKFKSNIVINSKNI